MVFKMLSNFFYLKMWCHYNGIECENRVKWESTIEDPLEKSSIFFSPHISLFNSKFMCERELFCVHMHSLELSWSSIFLNCISIWLFETGSFTGPEAHLLTILTIQNFFGVFPSLLPSNIYWPQTPCCPFYIDAQNSSLGPHILPTWPFPQPPWNRIVSFFYNT